MRGKRRRATGSRARSGITPACAGKTRPSCSVHWKKRDHPRVCGENAMASAISGTTLGSPPRVRGKQRRCRLSRDSYGITPACAGKTKEVLERPLQGKDHPRVCGENQKETLSMISLIGSPPRVRGKLRLNAFVVNRAGITPACAGKTFFTNLPYKVG